MIMPKEHTKRLCIIPLCKNERFDLVHKFPSDNQRAEEWRRAINLPEINNMPLDLLRKRTICSKHFRKEDYKNIESRSLNKTAIPSLNFRHEKIFAKEIVGVDTLMGCPILMQNKKLPVRTVSNNSELSSMNDRFKIIKEHKYVGNTRSNTTVVCEEGPSSKYRSIQLNEMHAIETQFESIPVTEKRVGRFVETFKPVIAAPNVEDAITLIDPSNDHLKFLTTNNTVDIVQNDHTYVNEITNDLNSSYISKYHSPLLITLLILQA